MRVLVYLHAYPPLRWLGGELMTARLLTALVDAGHTVTVLCRGAEHRWRYDGVEVVPRHKAVTSASLGGADLFVTHPEIAAYYYPRLAGMPYVGIVHNLSGFTVDGLKRYRPNAVVANADATAVDLAGLRLPVTTIHPPTIVRPEPPGVRGDFVTLVNMSLAKGADMFYAMAAARPGVQFLGVLGGHGEQMSWQDPMPPNVTVVGQTPSMGVVYAMSRAVVMPTVTETYGMVAAEALAHGVPVIANPLPGLREAAGDAAVWVQRTNLDGWLAALDDLMTDAGHARAAAAAAERRRFLLARTADDLARWVRLAEETAGLAGKSISA